MTRPTLASLTAKPCARKSDPSWRVPTSDRPAAFVRPPARGRASRFWPDSARPLAVRRDGLLNADRLRRALAVQPFVHGAPPARHRVAPSLRFAIEGCRGECPCSSVVPSGAFDFAAD
jgi:hypothetical protein